MALLAHLAVCFCLNLFLEKKYGTNGTLKSLKVIENYGVLV